MIKLSENFGRVVGAILFALLVSAQTISLAHTHEHEPVSFQDTACATCVSINQLAAVAVDHGHVPAVQLTRPIHSNELKIFGTAAVLLAPHQRGPPDKP